MTSNSELQNLDLINLISERHSLIRKIAEKAWNDQSDIYISNSEWYGPDIQKKANHLVCDKEC